MRLKIIKEKKNSIYGRNSNQNIFPNSLIKYKAVRNNSLLVSVINFKKCRLFLYIFACKILHREIMIERERERERERKKKKLTK